jgi:hypothetical protein
MSNPTNGLIGFDAAGRRWTLVYSVNALCRVEDALGEGAMAIAAMMADPAKVRVGPMRTMFWAGLADHHPELTLEGAGELMDAIGLPTAMEYVAKALTAAFPKQDGAGPLARAAARPGKRS